jgi:hypothetical protein
VPVHAKTRPKSFYWQIIPPPSCGKQTARCCSFCDWSTTAVLRRAGNIPQASSDRLTIRTNILRMAPT